MKMKIAAFLAACAVTIAAFAADAVPNAPQPPRSLSFADRIRAQEAIERVYYRHQIGATKTFEDAVSRSVLEAKVRKYLEESAALQTYWKTPVTDLMLERELERMANGTRMPERLTELYVALGNDAFLIEETLARATLVDRLVHNFYGFDRRLHREAQQAAETLRGKLVSGALDPQAAHPNRVVFALAVGNPADARPERKTMSEAEFTTARAKLPSAAGEVSGIAESGDAFTFSVVIGETKRELRIASYTLPKESWDSWWRRTEPDLIVAATAPIAAAINDPATPRKLPLAKRPAPNQLREGWENGILDDEPIGRDGFTSVWTGSVMLVWGGVTGYRFLDTGVKYDPLTDTWADISSAGAPEARLYATAIWSGREMIVWGGYRDTGENLSSGGRYDPQTDSWRPTSDTGAPSPRYGHTAVWSGAEMLIWGGTDDSTELASGGRYDPASDRWRAIGLSSAPAGTVAHSAVWTGSAMIVWGGLNNGQPTQLGSRYNPVADAWSPLSGIGAPSRRFGHTAVWTGNQMLIWGGLSESGPESSGGRYSPGTNSWIPISQSSAPVAASTCAVWSGSEMLLWGGDPAYGGQFGARYNPGSDAWVPMSLVNQPAPRFGAACVWTGDALVVWGGQGLDSGGRYDPVVDSWTPTATSGAPEAREFHTATWTGNVMFVWGGGTPANPYSVSAGGRYDPALDSWSAASTIGAPAAGQTVAVWTGQQVIVWANSGCTVHGGRYDPIADRWLPTTLQGAPINYFPTAVWTGTRMLVFGLGNCGSDSPSAGKYDPVADTWNPISTVGVGWRTGHTAVWTGSEMIIWGGSDSTGSPSSTGDRYDPVADMWRPVSNVGAPTARDYHTAIWTGTSMVVWGGNTNTGGRYDPVLDRWTATSIANAPTARTSHTAIWTGREMVVWGGYGDYTAFESGGRYDPEADTWIPTSLVDAPPGRAYHTAIWTGQSMIVWGGATYTARNDGGRYTICLPDEDGDGYSVCDGDCDDHDAEVHPDATERCNGRDDNCDGLIDEGTSALCNDGNPCTDDACQGAAECVHTSNDANPCDDGDVCTVADACLNGRCVGAASLACDDGNDCTDDACNPATGCTHIDTAEGTECNDGNACSTLDACDGAGHCLSVIPLDCDDGNPCTDDACNSAAGCVHTNNTAPCNDGNACTSADVCGGGSCHGGTPIACNDGNVCTDDTCNPATGCVFTNNSVPCSDGNACTTGDVCGGGSCRAGAPVVCGAADECHDAGVCNPATGTCSSPAKPDGTACDDASLCTTGETCQSGTCTPASSGLNEPNPRSSGYYKRLCVAPHSGDQLTNADAVCVSTVAHAFAGISTVADLCAELLPSQPNNDPCDKTDDDLMVLALNICRARVCTLQRIDSQCGSNDTVGQSLAESDAILSSASRNADTCAHAKCLDEEINTGRALEMNTLTLRREGSSVRLSWRVPYLEDGTGQPTKYHVWRRVAGSLAAFTKIGTTSLTTYLDGASASGAFEYEVTAVMN